MVSQNVVVMVLAAIILLIAYHEQQQAEYFAQNPLSSAPFVDYVPDTPYWQSIAGKKVSTKAPAAGPPLRTGGSSPRKASEVASSPIEISDKVQGNNRKRHHRRKRRHDGPTYDDYPYWNNRPFSYWSNYISNPGWNNLYYPPGYYPAAYGLYSSFDQYDYTNNIVPYGNLCFARISISDAFGPYTAGVMGKQAWLDWAGRNGFNKVFLDRSSVTNDHALVNYVGNCPAPAQVPPDPSIYQPFNATPNYF